uniref:NADH dehydrogenase subunit 3 n=1 Tax=Inocellia biprocessus TaxID=3018580 RepID=UPI0022FDA9CE|nr:NADH dehydrogenase subunit 3 [Inocellia biprocessus]WBK02855.1 NADH dehydrogenase subunit 3 [Inocellia biprocessus]
MYINMIMIMIFTIISLIMMIICSIISKKTFMDREKNSPFECGFDPMNSARIPFSMHFFLIAVIFLIFDVEITLIFPLIMVFNFSMLNNWIWINLFFMLILLLGIYHEWNQGALDWTNK